MSQANNKQPIGSGSDEENHREDGNVPPAIDAEEENSLLDQPHAVPPPPVVIVQPASNGNCPAVIIEQQVETSAAKKRKRGTSPSQTPKGKGKGKGKSSNKSATTSEDGQQIASEDGQPDKSSSSKLAASILERYFNSIANNNFSLNYYLFRESRNDLLFYKQAYNSAVVQISSLEQQLDSVQNVVSQSTDEILALRTERGELQSLISRMEANFEEKLEELRIQIVSRPNNATAVATARLQEVLRYETLQSNGSQNNNAFVFSNDSYNPEPRKSLTGKLQAAETPGSSKDSSPGTNRDSSPHGGSREFSAPGTSRDSQQQPSSSSGRGYQIPRYVPAGDRIQDVPENNDRRSSSTSNATPPINSARNLQICQRHIRGDCPFGTDCRHVHVDNSKSKQFLTPFNFSNKHYNLNTFNSRASPGLGQPAASTEPRSWRQRQRTWTAPGRQRHNLGQRNVQVDVQINDYKYDFKNDLNVCSPPSQSIISNNKPILYDSVSSSVKFNSSSTKISDPSCKTGPPRRKSKPNYLSLNILASNCRSFTAKKKSLEKILADNSIDIAIISELNLTKNTPKIKNYFQFCNLSNRKCHGIGVFCQNYLQGQVMRVPEEDPELEIVHIVVKSTVPYLHLIATYLDCEGRQKQDKIDRVFSKLKLKVQGILETGQSCLLLGDFNRNIDAIEKSFGTKLLMDWMEEDTLKIINDPNISTRIDPVTKKGSTLDLGIISRDIEKNIISFEVDTKKDLTPFSIHKKHNEYYKKFTDHLSINLKIKLPAIKQKKQRKVPVINMNNPEGWKKYKTVTDKYADIIENKVNNVKHIDLLEADLHVIELDILLESFGVTFRGPGKKIKAKKNTNRELKEMLQEDIIEMDELLSSGYNAKDLNQKIFKLRKAIIGPKIKAQETMAINDPSSGELITDSEQIKDVSLQHNIKILTKKPPREKDKEEIKKKLENHKTICCNKI